MSVGIVYYGDESSTAGSKATFRRGYATAKFLSKARAENAVGIVTIKYTALDAK
jgi:hypothetical protein